MEVKIKGSDRWCPNGCGKRLYSEPSIKGVVYKCQDCDGYWSKKTLIKYWRDV